MLQNLNEKIVYGTQSINVETLDLDMFWTFADDTSTINIQCIHLYVLHFI